MTRKQIVLLLSLLALAALVFLALRPPAVSAEIGEVVAGPLEVTLDEEGETRVHDRFVVSAPLAGRVLRIELEAGDSVIAGETVLAIFQPNDPGFLDARAKAEATASMKAAKASFGRAQALLEQAAAAREYQQSLVKRYEALAADGILSQDQLETVVLELETRRDAETAARFEVSAAEHNLRLAEAGMVDAGSSGVEGSGTAVPILSPIDGVVLRVLRQSEAVVQAGEALLEVADPRKLEIVADYLSSDAVRIQAGQTVWVERWGGEGRLEGRVRRVEPAGFTKVSALGVEEQRVNVILDLVGDPDRFARLGDGYRVEVRVVVWSAPETTKVPTSSLFRRGGRWAVFCVEEGKTRLREVEIGARNAAEAEVLSGLDAGDRVILYPSDRIEEGTHVTAVR